MTWMEWYDSLAKPSWTPAPATISLIWMILYPIILISFGFVFVRAVQGKVPRMVAVPFAVNLVAKLLFMLIFSGLRNVPLVAVDIVIRFDNSAGKAGIRPVATRRRSRRSEKRRKTVAMRQSAW
jgi:tryptophan-rich sensory protein